jgi:hypothetical protein
LRNVKGRYAVDIDFKSGPKNSADILHRILEEEGPFDHLVTIFVRRIHFDMLKELSAIYRVRPHYISAERTRQVVEKWPLEVMGLRRKAFSMERARVIRKHGLHLFSNVMGRKDHEGGYQDAVDAGSLFIQTDHLDRLVPYLQKNGLYQPAVLSHNFEPMKSSGLLVNSQKLDMEHKRRV